MIDEDPNTKIDLVRYYNFTTFDVMGDLTFGEPLHLLDNAEYDDWVKLIFRSVKFATRLGIMQYYPILEKPFKTLLLMLFATQRSNSFNYSVQRVTKRLDKGRDVEGVDVWDLVLGQEEENRLSRGEMDSNAALFMIAGTETTATLLSGLTYFLLKDPEKIKNLSNEIRGTFANSEDITMEAIAGLPYLNACIKEGLRLYPPVATGLPRITPPQGCTICGEYIPPEVSDHLLITLGIWDGWWLTLATIGYCIYTAPCDVYLRIKLQRSSQICPGALVGRRALLIRSETSCAAFFHGFPRLPGQEVSAVIQIDSILYLTSSSMAYHEMRLIMARMIYNFDLSLCPESDQWSDQEVYILWQKIPLMVTLKVVENH